MTVKARAYLCGMAAIGYVAGIMFLYWPVFN